MIHVPVAVERNIKTVVGGVTKIVCLVKKQKSKTKKSISIKDYIKAIKKGNRAAEQELCGPGFHSSDRIHQSKKVYTRKQKHKNTDL